MATRLNKTVAELVGDDDLGIPPSMSSRELSDWFALLDLEAHEQEQSGA